MRLLAVALTLSLANFAAASAQTAMPDSENGRYSFNPVTAAASFSMTCSLFFSLLLAVSMRQVDIASKAAFTAFWADAMALWAKAGQPDYGAGSRRR